jgi:hypothetical protein
MTTETTSRKRQRSSPQHDDDDDNNGKPRGRPRVNRQDTTAADASRHQAVSA